MVLAILVSLRSARQGVRRVKMRRAKRMSLIIEEDIALLGWRILWRGLVWKLSILILEMGYNVMDVDGR